jgi:death-on-curing protein
MRPQSSGFGVEIYPDLFMKAGALLHALSSTQGLFDGNKRTAWACTVVFLDINGHELLDPLDEETADDLILAAAQSRIDVPEIAERLRMFFD